MSFSEKILKWFDTFGRKDLPWQQTPTPYRVWVSEIMLQQTQVTTVIPYFLRFMDSFPNISKLALAPLDEVFALWAGLGYYARAKNLHRTAQIIHTQHNGIFPLEYETVIALPGIGPSTAGAILSIGDKQRYPILDGNVKRVLCRQFAVNGWPGDPKITKKLWQLSEKSTPFERVHHYTQAIMDLGATLCTRSKPKCTLCPVASTCKAKQLNCVKDFPTARPRLEKPVKSVSFLLLVHPKQKKILLERRPTKGIWGGLWSLPECPVATNIKKWCEKYFKLTIQKSIDWEAFRHTFTHYHLDIHPILCQLDVKTKLENKSDLSNPNFQWHEIIKINHLGLPAPVKKLLAVIEL